MQIVGGLIGIAFGFVLIKYSIWITETFGRVGWAEEHMRGGLGGTYSLYRIVGLIFIILSLMYIFGAIGFITGPLGSVFGGVKQSP